MLLTHIIIASLSIIISSLAFIKPVKRLLMTGNIFIVATVASGTYLIFSNQVSILKTCLVGLAYLAVIITLTVLSRVKSRKLAKGI